MPSVNVMTPSNNSSVGRQFSVQGMVTPNTVTNVTGTLKKSDGTLVTDGSLTLPPGQTGGFSLSFTIPSTFGPTLALTLQVNATDGNGTGTASRNYNFDHE